MSMSVDLYSYNFEKLINKILTFCKTDDKELVEKVLLSCGNKIGDKYIILNQELWEEYNCYYNVARVLEKIFHVEDVFGNVFCTWKDNEVDKEDLVQAKEINFSEDGY